MKYKEHQLRSFEGIDEESFLLECLIKLLVRIQRRKSVLERDKAKYI